MPFGLGQQLKTWAVATVVKCKKSNITMAARCGRVHPEVPSPSEPDVLPGTGRRKSRASHRTAQRKPCGGGGGGRKPVQCISRLDVNSFSAY